MNHEIFKIIQNRRTVRQFNQKPITKNTIEKIIEAATWAPNHRSTEPWRFFVLEKNSAKRLEIANLIYDWTYLNVKNPNEERKLSSAISANAPAETAIRTSHANLRANKPFLKKVGETNETDSLFFKSIYK